MKPKWQLGDRVYTLGSIRGCIERTLYRGEEIQEVRPATIIGAKHLLAGDLSVNGLTYCIFHKDAQWIDEVDLIDPSELEATLRLEQNKAIFRIQQIKITHEPEHPIQ